MYVRRWCSCADALVLSLRRGNSSRRCCRVVSMMLRPSMPRLSTVPVRHFKVCSSSSGHVRTESSASRQEASSQEDDEGEDDEGSDEQEEEDEFATDTDDVKEGDGEDGGGIVIEGISWGQKALDIAQTMLPSDGDLAIYAFKASTEMIQIRLDKLTDEYGSPSVDEVATFSKSYGKLLAEAGEQKVLPVTLSLEVSSPGAERVVKVPGELLRFKELPMHVCYTHNEEENEAVFRLDSFDAESGTAVWRLADVRVNREALGKGRVLNRKQRDWRLELPFSSIKLVRLHVDTYGY